MLAIEDLHVFYGGIHALKGVALEVKQGEIVALLGNNGAGKTTTLKSISGLVSPRRGRITLEGRPLSGAPPHEIVLRGIAHVPEGAGSSTGSRCARTSMGAYLRSDDGVPADLDRVFALFPILRERLGQSAGTLSGASSRCSPSGGPSWRTPASCCSTSRAWDSPRSWWSGSSKPSRASTGRGRPSCSWSRTLRWRWPSRTAATSSRPGGSRSTARPRAGPRRRRAPRVPSREATSGIENGEVTLTGTVRGPGKRGWLEEMVDDVFGVEEVHNRLPRASGHDGPRGRGAGPSEPTDLPPLSDVPARTRRGNGPSRRRASARFREGLAGLVRSIR